MPDRTRPVRDVRLSACVADLAGGLPPPISRVRPAAIPTPQEATSGSSLSERPSSRTRLRYTSLFLHCGVHPHPYPLKRSIPVRRLAPTQIHEGQEGTENLAWKKGRDNQTKEERALGVSARRSSNKPISIDKSYRGC